MHWKLKKDATNVYYQWWWAPRFGNLQAIFLLCQNGWRQTLRCSRCQHWWGCCQYHRGDLWGSGCNHRRDRGQWSKQSQGWNVFSLRRWRTFLRKCSWMVWRHSFLGLVLAFVIFPTFKFFNLNSSQLITGNIWYYRSAWDGNFFTWSREIILQL